MGPAGCHRVGWTHLERAGHRARVDECREVAWHREECGRRRACRHARGRLLGLREGRRGGVAPARRRRPTVDRVSMSVGEQ